MKEYPTGGKDAKEQYFSYKLSSARIVIEYAFGRLKARFGALRREMDINLEDLPNIIYSCFVLHNFCEVNNEYAGEESAQQALQKEKLCHPQTGRNHSNTDMEGKRIRNVFKLF